MGLGFYLVSVSYSGAMQAAHNLKDTSELKIGSNIGGVAAEITQSMQLAFDLRWHHWHHGLHFHDTVINNLTPSLRLSYGL